MNCIDRDGVDSERGPVLRGSAKGSGGARRRCGRLPELTYWVVAILVFLFADISVAQQCAGDCDGDNAVSISELITGVGIALGQLEPSACRALDTNADDSVAIDELIAAVIRALNNCMEPAATATPDATDTPADGSTPTRTPAADVPTSTHTTRITPTPTPTQPDPTTVVPSGRVTGSCRRPGPGGLVACDPRTVIRVFRCSDERSTCAQRFGARTLIGQGEVASAGAFSIPVDPELVARAILVLEADVEATIYRLIDIGAAVVGGTRVALDPVAISPISEAAVVILDRNGLANFPEEGFAEVSAAVEAANTGTDFNGLGVAEAAQVAELNATQNAAVTDAVMQNKSGVLCEDTVWRAAASPFVVVQNVIVGGSVCLPGPTKVTLRIEPGVQVLFRRDLALIVRSTLLARGTEANPIRFTSAAEFAEAGDWDGIRFAPESVDAVLEGQVYQSGSIIEHATIEYAGGTANTGVVDLDEAAPFLFDTTVRKSSATFCLVCVKDAPGVQLRKLRVLDGTAFSAVSISDSSPSPVPVELAEAEINRNSAVGVSLSRGALVIRDSSVTDNGSHGITSDSDTFVLRSTVSGNDGHGIGYTIRSSRLRVRESRVENNAQFGIGDIPASGGNGVSLEIKNNLFTGNGTGGLITTSDRRPCEASGNCFIDNPSGQGVGIALDRCLAQFNTLIRDRVRVFGGSEMIEGNNLIDSPIALEMVGGATTPDFDAPDNWWGTTSIPSIRARIFDCTMNSSRGCIVTSAIASNAIAEAPGIESCRNRELPEP